MTKTLVTNNNTLQYGRIIEESTKGNFKSTFEYITVNFEGRLDNKKALNILIACCNACVYCKENISEDYLLKILKSVSPYLKDLKEADIVSYVQSLYHFIKFFIYKDQLDYIVHIEDITTPAFLPPATLSKKQKETYNNIARLLHNVVAKSATENNNVCNTVFFKISILMLRICIQLGDSAAIVNLSLSCFKNLSCIKLSLQYQIEYYQEFLNLLTQYGVKLKSEDLVKIVINMSSQILHNIVQTYDFEKGLKFLNTINLQASNILESEECHLFLQVLQVYLILPCKTLKDKHLEINKCIKSIKEIHKVDYFEANKDFVQYSTRLLQTLKEYYTNINHKEWVSLSEDVQILFFKCIIEIDSLLFSRKNRTENMFNCVSDASVIFSLIKTAINDKRSLKYHQESLNVINTYLKHLEEIKKCNCEHWSKFWNHLAAEIYNTGIHLVQKNLDEAAKYYFFLVISYFIKLEDKNNITLKYNILQSVCTSLVQIFYKSKDNEKCLAFISLGTLLCMKTRDSFMTKWITLKHNCRNDIDVQKLNLVRALDSLKNEVPALTLDVTEKQFLLNLELENYKKKWKSKVPIVSVLKELQKISNEDYIVNVIVKMFIDIDLLNHKELYNMVDEILRNYKHESATVDSKMNLAILYYIHYKYCTKEAILKNAEDMENASTVVPIKSDTDLNDPKDDCDVISSFESLHLEVHKKNLENLVISLTMFTELVPLLKTDNHTVTFNQLFNIILLISSEFKLLCYKLRAAQALELALTIAQLQNDSSNIIKAIGLTLEQADVQNETTKQLLKIADDLIEDDRLDRLEIILMYLVSKSKALLYNDYEESYKVFKKANDLSRQVEDTNNFLSTVKSQLFLLNSEFSMLPCNLGVETHKKSILMNAYLATEVMYEEYKNDVIDDPYRVSQLIEANKTLVKLYHYLKCPREVRIYAKEILLLTQKLVLPLHTVSYLMYLAHADLLSNYQEDCNVKVKDMAVILGCQESIQGAMYLKQPSPSSPSLTVPLSYNAYHKHTCYCYYCVCYEYQVLALEKARLSALVNVKERNLTVAQEYFQIALNLYDYYVAKYLKNKIVVPDFLPTYGYVLLNYSSHLWRLNRKSEAKDFNKMLLTLLEEKKLRNVNLYNEGLLQKLGYVTDNVIPVSELQVEMEQLQISGDKEVPKTPENNKTEVSVMVERPNFTSQKKIKVKKCLPFSFSPNDLSKENKVLPKIKIYSQNSVKKIKEKPTASALPPPPVVPPSDSCNSIKDEVLKTRTRLLTEKLKHSTKKSEPSGSENPIKSGSTSDRSNMARKNLLKELSAPDSSVEKGAIRRSARTRK